MTPASLKDLRRKAARHGSPIYVSRQVRPFEAYVVQAGRLFSYIRPEHLGFIGSVPHGTGANQIQVSDLDRLISRLGAHWRAFEDERDEGESRPKDTSVVADSSGEGDGALHGGSGNSGEVDARAETASSEARKEGDNGEQNSQLSASASTSCAVGEDGSTSELSPSERQGREGSETPNGCAKGAVTEDGDGDRQKPAPLTGADDPARDEQDVAGASDERVGSYSPAEQDDEPSCHGDGLPYDSDQQVGEIGSAVRIPIRSFGGDTAEDWGFIEALSARARRHSREVERALRRLIRDVDLGGVEQSPRVDARKLVRELVSRRYSVSRAVRQETALPLVVLAADVSGSCSAASTETLAAAVSLAGELEHVIVVRHSNGHVIDAIGSAAREVAVHGKDVMLSEVVLSLARPLACVVAWGDWDAGACYQRLCEESVRFFWLDSYCASYGPAPASARLKKNDWRRQPAGWWQGVNSAATTAIALRAIARETR